MPCTASPTRGAAPASLPHFPVTAPGPYAVRPRAPVAQALYRPGPGPELAPGQARDQDTETGIPASAWPAVAAGLRRLRSPTGATAAAVAATTTSTSQVGTRLHSLSSRR